MARKNQMQFQKRQRELEKKRKAQEKMDRRRKKHEKDQDGETIDAAETGQEDDVTA